MLSLLRLASGVNTKPVSWEIVRVELVVTSVPSEVFKVPPVGTAVTVMVKLFPSGSVGAVILSAWSMVSSFRVTVLSAAATGVLLGGVGWIFEPPPPPQAASAKEAKLGNPIPLVLLDCLNFW